MYGAKLVGSRPLQLISHASGGNKHLLGHQVTHTVCIYMATCCCLLVFPAPDIFLVTRLILAHMFGETGTFTVAVVDVPSVFVVEVP